MSINPSIIMVLLSAFLLFSCVGGECLYNPPVSSKITITKLETAEENYLKIFFVKDGKEDYTAENFSKILTKDEIEKIKADLFSKGLYPGAELIMTEEIIKQGTCTPMIRRIFTKDGKTSLY